MKASKQYEHDGVTYYLQADSSSLTFSCGTFGFSIALEGEKFASISKPWAKIDAWLATLPWAKRRAALEAFRQQVRFLIPGGVTDTLREGVYPSLRYTGEDVTPPAPKKDREDALNTDIGMLLTPIRRIDEERATAYLKWLAGSPFNHSLDDDPTEIPSLNPRITSHLRDRADECLVALGYNRAWAIFSPESTED
jgi:hypothetical protein